MTRVSVFLSNRTSVRVRDGLDPLATWHLPGGSVGQPARWANAAIVERREWKRGGPQGPIAKEERDSWINYLHEFLVMPVGDTGSETV